MKVQPSGIEGISAPGRVRRWLIRLGLLLLLFCSFILLVEVGGRLTGLLIPPSNLMRFSETKGYELNPTHQEVNANGLRDREFPLQKPPDTFRILAIGDSFTYGDGVTQKETYVKQLEALLNQKLGNRGLRYEVLNAGVPGYNTQQELIHFNEVGRPFDPDLILLEFTLNDAELGMFGLKNVEGSMGLMRLKQWIKANFALYSFVRGRVLAWQSWHRAVESGLKGGDESVYPLVQAAVGKSTAGWEHCRQSLKGFASTANALNIPILLVIYPMMVDLDDTYPFKSVHTLIAKTATDSQLPVVDLLPRFMGHDASVLWASSTNHHPNAAAHAIAANGIYSALIASGFIENSALSHSSHK
jgi:GDSL-like Lipase/Acylhydrolase family